MLRTTSVKINNVKISFDEIPDDIILVYIIPALTELKYIVTLSQVNKKFQSLIENHPTQYNVILNFETGHQENFSGNYGTIFKKLREKKGNVNALQNEIQSSNKNLTEYQCMDYVCIKYYTDPIKAGNLGCYIGSLVGTAAGISTGITAGITACFGCIAPTTPCCMLGLFSSLAGIGAFSTANIATQFLLSLSTNLNTLFNEKAQTTAQKIQQAQHEINDSTPTGIKMIKM